MNLDLEAIALDLLLDSDDYILSVSRGGIRLDFTTSTALHPLRRAVRALLLSEETSLAAKLLAEQRMTKLEKIGAWAAHQACDNFCPIGIPDERRARVCGDPTCGSCSARTLGASD